MNTIIKFLIIDVLWTLLSRSGRTLVRGSHGILFILSPMFKFIVFVTALWVAAMLIHPGLAWYEFQRHIAGPLGLILLVIGCCTLPGWLARRRQPLRPAQAYRRRDADVWATGRKRAAHVKRDGKYFPWSDNVPFGDEK
jgi:hypothetical protein